MKPSRGCSGITKHACTQLWAISVPSSSNRSGIAAPKQSQAEGSSAEAGYGKAGKQTTLSNFPTATTTTNYNYLWDTDSEGKVSFPVLCASPPKGIVRKITRLLGCHWSESVYPSID